jgi:hypothetical protein
MTLKYSNESYDYLDLLILFIQEAHESKEDKTKTVFGETVLKNIKPFNYLNEVNRIAMNQISEIKKFIDNGYISKDVPSFSMDKALPMGYSITPKADSELTPDQINAMTQRVMAWSRKAVNKAKSNILRDSELALASYDPIEFLRQHASIEIFDTYKNVAQEDFSNSMRE